MDLHWNFFVSFVTLFAVIFLSSAIEATPSSASAIEATPSSECGKLASKDNIPWVVGVYLEKEKDHLELVCLGTVLRDHYVITASQCVCETLSSDLRKERVYVSKDIQKVLKKTSNTVEIKRQNVMKPKEYKGFFLNPVSDVAVLKMEGASGSLGASACVDWSDLTKLLQGNTAGIMPVWDTRVQTVDSSFLDSDICTDSTSEDFGRMLTSDKNCFKTSGSNLDSLFIGSGIYYQNPKDGRWYLEGVVSTSEGAKEGSIFLAATYIRRYLTWISRACSS